MKIKLFALIDCSSFYCSCERVFRPELKNKSICVLSNNDGCVISLTPEVKSLGIRIGTPLFKVKDILRKNNVSVFSSNYCLYADMSRRVIQIIKSFGSKVEQYSIDEAFLELDADEDDIANERIRLERLAEEIYQTVLKGTGIPVRVSIAETKTLAKVGSEYTKQLLKEKKIPIVCFWKHPEKEKTMKILSIDDVWGIGRAWGEKLKDMGIHTSYNLKQTDALMIGKRYNIVLQKTTLELQGIVCHDIETKGIQRKSIIRSRSFAKKISDPKLIQQAVSSHMARGAEKLRQEHLVAGTITVVICTGSYLENKKFLQLSVQLSKPTNDSFVLGNVASDLFKKCHVSKNEKGEIYQYSKAGVVFSDLKNDETSTSSFFDFINTDNTEIMKTIDGINKRFGKNAITLASQGVKAGVKDSREWSMKRNHMSPRYTTVWKELMRVKIG